MAQFKPTPAQQQAISDRGQNILVSASAGSGKTAVLVQRVISLIKEGTDVNRLLMVTFTDAAAKNMRDKIRAALQKEATESTNSAAMKRAMARQMNLVATADISTIHAFCLKLIKRYYYLINLDPQFRLLTDDTERLLLQEDTWQQFSEHLYAEADQRVEGRASFRELVLNFSRDRDDTGLDDLVLQLSKIANAQPDPEAWLKQLPDYYFLGNSEVTKSQFFTQDLEPLVDEQMTQLINDSHELVLRMQETGYEKPTTVLTADQELLQQLKNDLTTCSWDQLRANFQSAKFKRLAGGPTKKSAGTPEYEAYQAIKSDRDRIKKQLKQLSDQFFVYPADQLKSLSHKSQELVAELVQVVIAYRHRYQQVKLNRHVLEFNDLEHYAYQILTPPADDADWQALVADLRNHYREIMVDEYQDTNPLQESILTKLASPDRHNMFMVGDVKQSIYRFREADPSLFTNKYHRYQQAGHDGEDIVLAENFRSMRKVVDFTNLLFEQLMDQQIGQIDYDDDAHLKYAATYYDEDDQNQPQPTELLLYDANADADQPSEDDKLTGELRMVGMRIKQMIARQEQIYDSNLKRMRPINYGDIVLLERTKGINNTLMEQFNQLNIPLTVHDVESYFQATEVRVMMALLKVIDNPHQDIQLVAVLRSPIVGLSNKELTMIRLQNRSTDFYTACRTFVTNFDQHRVQRRTLLPEKTITDLATKLKHFLAELTEFSQTAQQQTLVDLIWDIYQRTGYLDYVGAMPGGQQRQANLHALYERAQNYEQTSFKGLYQFTRFIEKMQEHDQDLGVAPAQLAENTVNVMTIHGSKGLQFPIVFLIDATHGFNNSASKGAAVADADAGLGIRYMDENRLVYDTPQRQVILEQMQRSERAEGLRVLYVALTRAEQRLIISASFNEERANQKLKTAWERWQKAFQSDQQTLGAQVRVNANSFMDWIGLACARYRQQFNPRDMAVTGEGKVGTTLLPSPLDQGQTYPWMNNQAVFQVRSFSQHQVTTELDQLNQAPASDDQPAQSVDPQLKKHFADVLGFQYPYQVATQTTAYQSVTDVKRVFEDPDNRQMGQWDYDDNRKTKHRGVYLKNDFATPRFVQQADQSPAATEVGTATHLVFQKIPLDHQTVDQQLIATTIDQLVDQQLITPNVAHQIDQAGVAAFFATPVGQQILHDSHNYHREAPFAMLMNGHELFRDVKAQDDERILIHGIIDGYLQQPTGITLVDYKTDHINPHNVAASVDQLKNRYRGQLELYRQALNMMKEEPVVQMGLYLVELRKFIPFTIGGEPGANH